MLINREILENEEDKVLASYAMKSRNSRGRKYPEEEHPYRTRFQRDRDRIIHSTAFRRLEYKTQVFVNHEGDLYRTRLTHTLEVAQIARTLARSLRVNEDLAESIALAHDLGHTPFGHSGEVALNELLKEVGGFEHNRQSFRVVDELENRYYEFPGLNLTYEVKEGLVKHKTAYDHPSNHSYHPEEKDTIESQIVNVADEIAYSCHDVDDGLYSGILNYEQLIKASELCRILDKKINSKYNNLNDEQRRHILVRYLIDYFVSDILKQSEENLKPIESIEDVRKSKEQLICSSKELEEMSLELKKFLYANMYRHYRVLRMSEKAKRVINALFEIYKSNPEQMPPNTFEKIKSGKNILIVIGDYIAGMTDRYALTEYNKLFDPFERV